MRGLRLWEACAVAAAVAVALVGCESGPMVRGGISPQDLVLTSIDPVAPPAVRAQKSDTDPPVAAAAPREAPPAVALPARGLVPVNATLGSLGQADTVAAIRATVNGVPILDSELREASLGYQRELAGLTGEERARQERKVVGAILDTLIERELLYQEAASRLKKLGKNNNIMEKLKEAADKEFQRWLRAAKAGFPSDEEFKEYLRALHTSVEGQRRMRERLFIAEEYLRSNIMRHVDRAASHEEVLAYYKSHPEEFTQADSMQWQDIFVLAAKYPSREEARRAAESLAARARAGEDFVKLCKEHDDGVSAAKNAAGIGTRKGDIRPAEAEEVLFGLKDGDVGPVIEIATGFHVIRLAHREYAGLRPFDDKVQIAIRDKIKNEVYQRERKRFLDELKKDAAIEKMRVAAP